MGAVRRGAGSVGTSRSGGESSVPTYVGAGSRDRDGRPISNTAIRRASPIGGGSYFDDQWLRTAGYPFSPWGQWYPWYPGGWGYGWVSYDPWRFGGTRWVWGRYGTWWYGATPWYDPWYDPYYGGYGMAYGGGGRVSSTSDNRPFSGSLRIKVSPSKGQVYIDGVLQGLVDDFDGLSNHLEIDQGSHQLEIRADGYETLTESIDIDAGKTQTFRGSLKKIRK
jgi:hypothetical protein